MVSTLYIAFKVHAEPRSLIIQNLFEFVNLVKDNVTRITNIKMYFIYMALVKRGSSKKT